MRILLAEDEKKVCYFIQKALDETGALVNAVHDGIEALNLALRNQYDVIVLDIMMPGRDGLSILRQLREKQDRTPILLLTARGEISERVEGLELGADDYVSKPFAMTELIARVNALGRRGGNPYGTTLRVSNLNLNLITRDVVRGERKINLALREFSLLEYLMRYPGKVLSRTNICEHVWDHHFDKATNVVDVYVNRLRRKIDDFHEAKLLHTVRGIGYMIKAPE